MKQKTIAILIAFGLELLIALAPYLPVTVNALPNHPDANSQLSASITTIGLTAAIMTALIGFLLRDGAQVSEDRHEELLDRLATTPTRRIRDSEFHTQFLTAARSSTERVFITYLAEFPPTEIPDTELKNYHDEMAKLPHRRKKTTFIRVIRDTPANREWAKSLLEAWSGKANASIGLLTEVDASDMANALSVQVVDKCNSWVVAVDAHSDTGSGRDYVMQDELLTACFASYFLRLWNKSTHVLENGRRVNKLIELGPKGHE